VNEPIWFNRPAVTGREIDYMRQALDGGAISGDGPFTKRCHALLEQVLGASRVLLTTSCTHALEMAALLLDIAPGDEVVCPAFTFVSSINAFALRGAVPRFVDIRPDTLNLDEQLLEAAITPRTKAILVVHYAGVSSGRIGAGRWDHLGRCQR
jgi:dTDP-4-amino-4,6-dideoxygalactose transaminase